MNLPFIKLGEEWVLTIERNAQKTDYGNKKGEQIIPSWIVAEVDSLNSLF